MSDLLPCPFCGSDDIEDESVNAVNCSECGAGVHVDWFPTMRGDEATAAWNRRSLPTSDDLTAGEAPVGARLAGLALDEPSSPLATSAPANSASEEPDGSFACETPCQSDGGAS